MPVEWESRFETGETRVDDQHKRLFEFVNKLEEMTRRDAGADEIEGVMSFLSMFVHVHFFYEEACMYRHKCVVAEKNKAAHERFLEAFEGFKTRYQREGGSRMLLKEIYDAANTWLVAHICRIDVTLRQCAAAR